MERFRKKNIYIYIYVFTDAIPSPVFDDFVPSDEDDAEEYQYEYERLTELPAQVLAAERHTSSQKLENLPLMKCK